MGQRWNRRVETSKRGACHLIPVAGRKNRPRDLSQGSFLFFFLFFFQPSVLLLRSSFDQTGRRTHTNAKREKFFHLDSMEGRDKRLPPSGDEREKDSADKSRPATRLKKDRKWKRKNKRKYEREKKTRGGGRKPFPFTIFELSFA